MTDADRDQILDAVLTHVAFEGWTEKAVRAGLLDLDLPFAAGRLAFPGGPAEMIDHWSATLDKRMEEEMVLLDPATMAVPERIAKAVRLRLDACRHEREAVRRALAFLALPPHQPLALRLTYRTVDAIWYAAGDRSTDFSFYTRRATLAAVYSATVLFWLDDESEASEATFAFLDRRLADVGRVNRLGRRLSDAFGVFTLPFAIFKRSPGLPPEGESGLTAG